MTFCFSAIIKAMKITKNKLLIFGGLAAAATVTLGVLAGNFWAQRTTAFQIKTFEDCVSRGNPVEKTFPLKCRTVDGQEFVRELNIQEEIIQPDSQSPAAGVCAESSSDNFVTIEINKDAPSPRCQVIAGQQSLRIKNNTDKKVNLWFGDKKQVSFSVEPGKEYEQKPPEGFFMPPGVYLLHGEPYQGPEIWVGGQQ